MPPIRCDLEEENNLQDSMTLQAGRKTVDPDQLASQKSVDLNLHTFQNTVFGFSIERVKLAEDSYEILPY